MSRTKRHNWTETTKGRARRFLSTSTSAIGWEWWKSISRYQSYLGRLKNGTYQPQSESLGSAVDENKFNSYDDVGGAARKYAGHQRRRKMKDKTRKELEDNWG